MKVVTNRVLPLGKKFSAINLFSILFVKRGVTLTPTLLNHERIHTAQQRELLFLPFYILYLLEWLYLLFRYRFDSYRAYRAISFEREAYLHEHNLAYLQTRHPFSQWKFH